LAAALVNNSGDTPNTGTQGATDKAFMAKGNAFMAKGNAFMAKGNTFISKGNAFMAKGNAFMAKGNDEVPPQRHRSEEPFGHSLMKGR
jgi:hypothetical protein